MTSEPSFRPSPSVTSVLPPDWSWLRLGARPIPLKTAGRIIGQIVAELILLFGDRVLSRRDRRRLACHVRQISMYVCHVALRIPHCEIARAFGRDATTVGHACEVVEDRRDDRIFDDFVSTIERIVVAIFDPLECRQ